MNLFPNQSLSSKRTGFTIVELLIVIVVIAILAAIVIVAYNGVARSAARSVLRSDAEQAVKLLQNYRTTNSNFPTTTASITGGLPNSVNTTYEYTATSTTFCLTVSSSRAEQSYYVTESNEIKEGTCPGHFGLSPPTVPAKEQLAVGYYHACTLAFNSTLYCWGRNGSGQLGNSSTTDSSLPVQVGNQGGLAGKTITSISAGQNHTCAIANGAAYCWGTQLNCQLGLETCTSFNSAPDVTTPTAVNTNGALSGKTLTDISAGYMHTCALATDGDVYCWGNAQWGTLGGGFGSSSSVTVSQPRNATAGTIVDNKTITDLTTGSSVTCVVADGAPYCWGADRGLGNGTDDSGLQGAGTYINTPLAVDMSGVLAGKTITDITAGSTYDTVCVLANGAPYCWGRGIDGQFGNGGTVDSEVPVATDVSGVLSGTTITSIDVSNLEHVCVTASGAAYCWGNNTQTGPIGDGTTGNNRLYPVAVSTTGGLSGKTVTTIQGGYRFSCALTSDNNVACWGSGANGRLGIGSSPTQQLTPLLVTKP